MEPLFLQFNKQLYKIEGTSVKSDAYPDGSVSVLGAVISLTKGDLLDPSNIISGSISGNLEFTGGYIQSANYVSGTTGWKLNSNGDFEGSSGTFRGAIVGGSINIPNATTPLFSVTSTGLVTAIGISTLNIKSYTSFETAARFTQVVDGGGAVTFNTSGLRLETSATATSSATNKWFASQNILNNSPAFSCSIEFGGIPTIGGVGFIGLGEPATFTGSGATFTGTHIGFQFQYQSGDWNLYGSLNNGGTEQFSLLTTVVSTDVLDLILKLNGTTSADFYYRKNSGTLTKTTITSTIPSSVVNRIQFQFSNRGNANNIICLVYSASYER